MRIRLIEETRAVYEALETVESYLRLTGATVEADGRAYCQTMVGSFLEFAAKVGAEPPWTGYLVVCEDTGLTVGCCGFKGNPDLYGCVEIAYHTFKAYEGRGFACAMARAMTAMAEPLVSVVCAHTLPERNASCRVLKKCGYLCLGEVEDPEDGTVWRWEKRDGETAGG